MFEGEDHLVDLDDGPTGECRLETIRIALLTNGIVAKMAPSTQWRGREVGMRPMT